MGWILATVLTVSGGQALGDEPRLADYFGFLPLEVYKLDPRMGNLILKDLDGDKTDDIVVVNNGRSRIDLLLSSKKAGSDTATAPAEDPEPNQISSDRRMRLVSVPVNKEVVSLQIADFDGDDRPDLAFFGNPAEIVIMLNDGQGGYTNVKRLNVGEAVETPNALTVGDLNRDGRADLALLQANEVEIIYQGEGGKLGEPERLPHTASNPRILRAVDLDGDGGDDLVILDGGTDDPIRVRFSTPGGKLGPEQRFSSNRRVRSRSPRWMEKLAPNSSRSRLSRAGPGSSSSTKPRKRSRGRAGGSSSTRFRRVTSAGDHSPWAISMGTRKSTWW